MKIKAKRRRKRIDLLADISEVSTQNDTIDIVRVHDHHLVLYVDVIDINTISAGWVFTHNGQYYGDHIRYKCGVKDNTTQVMKDALVCLIDQQSDVRGDLALRNK